MSALDVREFAARLSECVRAGEDVAVATVVSVDGSASAQPGAKAIIDAQGRVIWGWVGGGCAETHVADAARQALLEERPRMLSIDLEDEVLGVGMPCGGHMEVYVEPMKQAPKLLVLGHGRIAEMLTSLGADLGFRVVVNDALATAAAFPRADERIVEDPEYAKVDADADTYVVITTQHKSDYEALTNVLRHTPGYVGLVASRKRSALLFERLHEDGFAPDLLRRVSAPAGLDLGAQTPEEIALSIVAEILRRRRGDTATGRPLAEVKGVQIDGSGVTVPEGSFTSEKCPR